MQGFGIPENQQKERYSLAYLYIISAIAGFGFIRPSEDYGVDALIQDVERKKDGSFRNSGTILEFQLKATQKWKYSKERNIIYSLEVKNYNDLINRRYGGNPLVLGVLCLPKCGNFHPCSSCISLILKHAMYWYIPPGNLSLSNNTQSVNIHIPIKNLLTADALFTLMQDYKQKGGIN